MMNKQNIQCCSCKEDFDWDEPEGYDWTDLMPDGVFTNSVPGEWICLDCSYCENCYGDLLQNECICDEE